MNDNKKKQLIAWLESMPWWKELPYAKLETENEALQSRKFVYVSESGLHRTICMISGEPWMCYKHADGQWVTLNKITLLTAEEQENG